MGNNNCRLPRKGKTRTGRAARVFWEGRSDVGDLLR